MRTYKKCYGYLKENLLDPLDPDVFIHTWEKAGTTTKISNSDESTEETITTDTLETLYAPEKVVIEPFQDEYFTHKDGIAVPEVLQERTNHWKGNIPLFYKMKRCNELKSEYENEQDFTYDIVIKMRPDLILLEPIPDAVLKNPQVLWHSGANVDTRFQVSDKFALSSSENMDYYTSVWDVLDQYWERPFGDGNWEDVRVGERLMNHHMSQSNIPVEPFNISVDILRSREFTRKGRSIGFRDVINHARRLASSGKHRLVSQ